MFRIRVGIRNEPFAELETVRAASLQLGEIQAKYNNNKIVNHLALRTF